MKYKWTAFRKNENYILNKEYNKKLNKSFDRFGEINIENNLDKWEKLNKKKELKMNYKFFYDKMKVNLKEFQSKNYKKFKNYKIVSKNKKEKKTIKRINNDENIEENLFNILYNRLNKNNNYYCNKKKISELKIFFKKEFKNLKSNFDIIQNVNYLKNDINLIYNNFKKFIWNKIQEEIKNGNINYEQFINSKYSMDAYQYLIKKIQIKTIKVKKINEKILELQNKIHSHKELLNIIQMDLNNYYNKIHNIDKHKRRRVSFNKIDHISYNKNSYKMNENYLNEKQIITELSNIKINLEKNKFYYINKLLLIKNWLKKVIYAIIKLDGKLIKTGVINILVKASYLKINIKKKIFSSIIENEGIDYLFKVSNLKYLLFEEYRNKKKNWINIKKQISEIKEITKKEKIRLKIILNTNDYNKRMIYYFGIFEIDTPLNDLILMN